MTAFNPVRYWYCGSTKWSAVAAWASGTAYAAGVLVRQLATPTTGSERVFVCIVAGTSGGSEPTWTVTQGAKTTDNTVTWMECTGKAGVNGDLTNTPSWSAAKGDTVVLGEIIQRASAGSLQICTTAGTAGSGSEPAFSNTAGTTTVDNTVTWTSLGAPSNFAAYAAAAARLYPFFTATTFIRGGDVIFVSNNHAETQASAINYDGLISSSSVIPIKVICVNDSVAPPTATATTASITTTGANALAYADNTYTYGITFNGGTGSGTSGLSIGSSDIFESCTFNTPSTGAAQIYLGIGGTLSYGKYINCTFVFGATTQNIKLSVSSADIINGTFAATGSVPTTLFSIANACGPINISDSDLSNISGNLVNTTTNGPVYFNNCKLNASATVLSTTPGALAGLVSGKVVIANCDSGATNYRLGSYGVMGTTLSETSIVRTGGATNGTTAESFKITTNANASYYSPYVSEEIAQWSSLTSGSHTATFYLTTNATLDNSQFWMELEYSGNSSYPIGTRVSSRVALLGSPTTLTTDTSTWGGTAQANIYKVVLTFSPLMAGPVKARAYLAAASTTVYLDPLITIA